jgi:hypothetical protein
VGKKILFLDSKDCHRFWQWGHCLDVMLIDFIFMSNYQQEHYFVIKSGNRNTNSAWIVKTRD